MFNSWPLGGAIVVLRRRDELPGPQTVMHNVAAQNRDRIIRLVWH
jgi:hypothetical protein